MKILLVEDDTITINLLTRALNAHNYNVNTAEDGETALQLAQAYDYDLIVLDVLIPKLDGISLCRELRSSGCQMPILLLTALDSSNDRVQGLEAGADDYVVKPFNLQELIARIRALLRRGKASLSSTILTWEKLQVNPDTTEVTYGEKVLHLTPKEYNLLELFLRNPRRIFSRSAILDRIWSAGEFPQEEAVTAHIKGLRHKLKAAGMTVDLVETVYGLGYRLKSLPEEIESPKVAPATLEIAKSQENVSAESIAQSQELSNDERRLQVLSVVAEIRGKLRANFIEKVGIFDRAIAQLQTGTLDNELRLEAQQQAHKLVGSLGTLGLPKGSEVARKIEQLFKTENIWKPGTAEQIEEFLHLLKQIFDRPPEPENELVAAVSEKRRILIVDDDTLQSDRLKSAASGSGFEIEVATSGQSARSAISQQPPDAILLDLTFSRIQENGITFLAELRTAKPDIPVMIFSGNNQLSDRIEVARLGASGFLHKSIPPADILKAVAQVLDQTGAAEAKVMVVDDDVHLLAALRIILQPWGLQVTTLDRPEKFWEVLETTCPDLLILDVEMPGYSGIELCLAVRNDLRWSKLPVLFLTAHSESETVRQMFVAGADDYVNKPIVEPELIARILNRLERTQLRHKLALTQR
ncbi:MAG: response regulator [Microcoleus sp. PH2017_10_PVI_O_A]|uniref:response regulator n=1 Tax=unclassified Microcoleus TaxID=2642155 RepID=UPI001E0CC101|nr:MULTISPECIES: response regulator [unclassified Microcoleus]TAE77392.1 MAG: response regulator [Oscillatoriales cyanobacterium]MCC3408722.1 response regulator [Microcoleus sp. PH2017_10_PVI_O_A]MCC3462809.1 response regulator [Microcoleus sp. PH2017_11_PCY_U_A]MCC3481292.1 response regulator [Microcoleus sp. PH2017_12_PCY_D_A]MCC3529513.1 response regulator [Microcoleus sp. PH2017_21_RUC_O_A]